MRRFSRSVFIALFLVTLIYPLIILSISREKNISMLEHRSLASKPEFPATIQQIQTYPQRYEAWFNDHFGMREKLVRLYNKLFISIFHSSPTFDVIVGKQQWLFLASQFVAHDFMGLHLYPKKRLGRWKKVLQERKRWLEKRGIHYLWLSPPNKIMVYPEFLPDRIRIRQGTTFLEQFQEYLHQEPKFDNTLDLLSLLRHAKTEQQLYHKSDTHWNSDGAYVAYRAIIRYLNQFFPEFKPIPKAKFIRKPGVLSGEMTRFLNLMDMYKEETSELYNPEMPSATHYPLLQVAPHPPSARQRYRTGDIRFHEMPEGLRTAIFISDSFGNALKPFLAPHFKRMILVKNARFEDITHLIEREQPDVVIDLNVARAMYISLGESVEIRDEVMAEEFRTRKGKLPASINGVNFQQNLKKISDVDLAPDGADRFSTSGEDPQLYFNLPKRLSEGILNLTCSLEVDHQDLFKIYFQTPKTHTYQEQNSIYAPLLKGRNDIYLRLFKPIRLDSLRLDPGEKQGDFRFIRFAFYEEPL